MTYTPSPPHTRRSGARGATILILCMIAVIALFAVSAGMSESEHTQDTTIPTPNPNLSLIHISEPTRPY